MNGSIPRSSSSACNWASRSSNRSCSATAAAGSSPSKLGASRPHLLTDSHLPAGSRRSSGSADEPNATSAAPRGRLSAASRSRTAARPDSAWARAVGQAKVSRRSPVAATVVVAAVAEKETVRRPSMRTSNTAGTSSSGGNSTSMDVESAVSLTSGGSARRPATSAARHPGWEPLPGRRRRVACRTGTGRPCRPDHRTTCSPTPPCEPATRTRSPGPVATGPPTTARSEATAPSMQALRRRPTADLLHRRARHAIPACRTGPEPRSGAGQLTSRDPFRPATTS